MIFTIINHSFKYDVEKIARLFLPFERFEFTDKLANENEDTIYTAINESFNNKIISVKIRLGNSFVENEKTVSFDENSQDKLILAQLLIKSFEKIIGYTSPWGVLTGVRPAKLIKNLISESNLTEAKRQFVEDFYVSAQKTELCAECAQSEEKIISLSKPNDFSLYISIPFCPTRCAYCSFVSHSVKEAKKLIPDYIKLLCKEIEKTGEIARQLNLNLKTVYIGGGTPTTFSAEQLKLILQTIKDNFDLSMVLEYTVEAGRPDTINEDKLKVIKSFGVSRISINPQTMQDEILKSIGRNHTVKMVEDSYRMARNVGFDNINMDLIAGLNGDTVNGFKDSLDKVIALSPESITVHSLSMKRASNLTANNIEYDFLQGKIASEMVDYSYSTLKCNDYLPYYMYRQSKTVGNLENVGYAKKGYESLYNVYIMDETHSILACGASAVTKLRKNDSKLIERVFNYKYPYEYIDNFDEILQRKDKIIDFYKN